MSLPSLPKIDHPEYIKSKQQVVDELQHIINRINNIPNNPPICMTSRKSGDWTETIISNYMEPHAFSVNIFTWEEEA